jgi:GNAT superfamily N-acetyltransferase
MSLTDWHEEPIGKQHRRDEFDCGEPLLNEYLRLYARKNHERGAAKTILAVANDDSGKVLGYYSVSPASIGYARVPEVARRGLGRYDVPGFRLGRLAVERAMQGQRLGGQLLLSAARRCILASQEVGGVVLLIDAKNERVASWYGNYGALSLPDSPLSLVLPLTSVQSMLQNLGKL